MRMAAEKYGPESLTPKAARVLAEMTQEDSAKMLNLSIYTLRNIELGRTPLTLRVSRDMARVYKLPGEYVFKV